MTPRRLARLKRRYVRLCRRRNNLLEAGPRLGNPILVELRAMLLEEVQDDPAITEDLDALAEAVIERVDELIPLAGWSEVVADFGLRAVVYVALYVVKNRTALLEHRLELLEQKIEAADAAVPRTRKARPPEPPA